MSKQVARIPLEDFLQLVEHRVLRLREEPLPGSGGGSGAADGADGADGDAPAPAADNTQSISQKPTPAAPKKDEAVLPKHLEKVQQAMQGIQSGCCVILVDDEDSRRYGLEIVQQDGKTSLLGVPLYACLAWKGVVSLTVCGWDACEHVSM